MAAFLCQVGQMRLLLPTPALSPANVNALWLRHGDIVDCEWLLMAVRQLLHIPTTIAPPTQRRRRQLSKAWAS